MTYLDEEFSREGNVKYRATNDFVFQSTSRTDILYNPRYMTVAKRISLKPLSRAVEAVENLLAVYNKTCTALRKDHKDPKNRRRFIKIPGRKMTATKGIEMCKKLGRGFKLLELKRKSDVTQFLSEIEEDTLTVPAGIYYDIRQHAFVYFSSHHPVKQDSAVRFFRYGDTIESYDAWDSYKDYFGQYQVREAQIHMNVVKSTASYDHVYCMTSSTRNDDDEEAKPCFEDFKFLSDISQTTIGRVHRLLAILNHGGNQVLQYSTPYHLRKKRTAVAGGTIALAAIIGGVVGAISTKAVTSSIPSEELRDAANQTDILLEALGERTNLLDINQRRMMILVEETQKRLNNFIQEQGTKGDRTAIHARINSILIHLGDHMAYIGHLLTSKGNTDAHNIALGEEERRYLVRMMLNNSDTEEVARGASIRLRFQMLTPDDLCIVMEIPMKTPVRSVALVKAFPFPSIRNGSLWVPQETHPLFLHLSGAFYVKLDGQSYEKCVTQGICKGLEPPFVAGEEGECVISQYFYGGTAKCPLRKTPKKQHLLYAGSTLFYTLLYPLRIRLECQKDELEDIKHIVGRRAFQTPQTCTLMSSKAISPVLTLQRYYM